MKFFKYLIQSGNAEPDYGVATDSELVAKLRKIAEETADYKCRSLPRELVEAFESGNFSAPPQHFEAEKGQLVPHPPSVEIEFMSWLNEEYDTDEWCAPPLDLTVSWEPEERVQTFADSLKEAESTDCSELAEIMLERQRYERWVAEKFPSDPRPKFSIQGCVTGRFHTEPERPTSPISDIHNPHSSVGC